MLEQPKRAVIINLILRPTRHVLFVLRFYGPVNS